ncbi:unnamed protein product [Sphagnum balticum]
MAPDLTGACLSIQNKILEDFGNHPRGDGTSDAAIIQYREVLEANLNLPDAASPAGISPHTLEIANQDYTEEPTEPVGTDGNPLLTDAAHQILDPELAASDVRPDLEMGLTYRNIMTTAMAHKVQAVSDTSVGVSLADHSGSVPVPLGNSFLADAYLTLRASTSSPGFEMRLTDEDNMPAAMAHEVHGVEAISVEVSLADLSGSVSVPPTDNEHKGEREKGMVGWENGGASPSPGLG